MFTDKDSTGGAPKASAVGSAVAGAGAGAEAGAAGAGSAPPPTIPATPTTPATPAAAGGAGSNSAIVASVDRRWYEIEIQKAIANDSPEEFGKALDKKFMNVDVRGDNLLVVEKYYKLARDEGKNNILRYLEKEFPGIKYRYEASIIKPAPGGRGR